MVAKDNEEIEIPKVQKAILTHNVGKNYSLEIVKDYPVPKPGVGEVLVHLTSSGVCHSDLSIFEDHWDDMPSMMANVGGHEGCGRIVSLGPGVEPSIVPIGLRVGVPLVHGVCHTCENCLIPDGECYCINAKYNGYTTNGTFCQYICIPADYVIPVPESIPEKYVGPILCGGVTVYKSIKSANLYSGQWVVIVGAGGGLGLMAIQYAIARGVRVISIDTGEDKEKSTKECGSEIFIDFKKEKDIAGVIRASTGGFGAHCVLVLAPSQNSYDTASSYLRHFGVLIAIGLPTKKAPIGVTPAELVLKGIRVMGTVVGNRNDMKEALDLAARGKFHPQVEIHPMEDVKSILDTMAAGKLVGRAVIELK